MVYVQEKLSLVTAGRLDRLMIWLPPRHGKSEMVTIRYPIWRMERDPELKVIIGAYNQILANRFNRQARRLAVGRLNIASDRAAVNEWETAEGGGIRAVGVGSGVTGHGGDLIIIDDPVKSREEASSEAYRERVNDWYTNDIYTRLEPGGAIVIIQTRWHEEDLAGKILASEDGPNWTVISLPADAEEDDPLGRDIGDALCPDRFPTPVLRAIQRVMGRDYVALYSQRPQPREGDMFKRHWFEIVPVAAAGGRRIRFWDKAATQDGGNYSVGVLMSEFGGIYYVEDVVRGQWSSFNRETVTRQTAVLDNQKWPQVVTWLEEEGGSGGKDSAAASVKNLAGFRVKTERPTGDKETRAEPFADQAEAGNVKMVKGDWNEDYLNELCSFPNGKFNDQVDGSSGAFNKLALGKQYPRPGAVKYA